MEQTNKNYSKKDLAKHWNRIINMPKYIKVVFGYILLINFF
jgi:hypothetical protein